MIDNQIFWYIGIAAAACILYWLLTGQGKQINNGLNKEIKEVLTKEEYKVKGKHE